MTMKRIIFVLLIIVSRTAVAQVDPFGDVKSDSAVQADGIVRLEPYVRVVDALYPRAGTDQEYQIVRHESAYAYLISDSIAAVRGHLIWLYMSAARPIGDTTFIGYGKTGIVSPDSIYVDYIVGTVSREEVYGLIRSEGLALSRLDDRWNALIQVRRQSESPVVLKGTLKE